MKVLMTRGVLKRAQKMLETKNHFVWILLYVCGVAGIALFADFRVNQNTFVSENALLPGYVITKYKEEATAVSLHREFSSLAKDARQQWIISMFQEYGLEVYTQNFTVNKPLLGSRLAGNNIYAVYRAPKTASTEAIVFSTTLTDEYTQHAIPLMMSVCKLIVKQTIWAKDVVFLVTEHGQYGVGAWLQAYHDIYPSSYIQSSPILTHSGAIQAALHLDMPVYMFDRLRMYVEAINGQLPDIDLVVLVRQICRQEGIHLLLRNKPHDIADFQGSLLGLHANMAWQAAGRITFPSSLYHPYNIHAVGIQTERMYNTRYKWDHMGRFTESVLRSINNLEEQFHTAYYFYLLPSIERFVCLSVYMVPCGLLLAATAARVMGLWLKCGKVSHMVFIETDVNVMDCVYPLLHGILFALSNELLSTLHNKDNILYIIVLSQVGVIAAGCGTKQRENWRLHQAFVLLLHVLTMALLCMLNISLTVFYAVPTTLAFLLQFPYNKPVRLLQRVILLASNPLLLVMGHSYLYTVLQLDEYKGNFLADLQTRVIETIESKYTLGVWTWSAYCYLLLPVWGLQWTLHIPDVPEDNTEVKDKTE